MSKIEKLKTKYVDSGQLQLRTFNNFVEHDNTPTKKYVDYMCEIYQHKRDFRVILKTIKRFNELLPYIENKDIYSDEYKSNYNRLIEVIEKAENDKEEKSFIRDEHVKVLLDNEDFILLIPKTHRGSLKYGANTKWCTAGKNDAPTFNNYIKNDTLFYVNRKKTKCLNPTYDKIAILVKSKNRYPQYGMNIFNSNDTEISIDTILNNSWTSSEIQIIFNKIHEHMMLEVVTMSAVSRTVGVVNIIKSINTTNLIGDIKLLESVAYDKLDYIKEQMTETIEKLQKINFTNI